MPDTLSLTTGLSVGLLAGIVSGVCYLVANGIAWPKPETRRCIPKKGDICKRCGGDPQDDVLPCICNLKQPVKFEKGAWFLRQVQKTLSLMPWTVSTEKLAQIEEERDDQDSDDGRDRGELRNVRHFLETLSAKLAGGPLDRTNVSPLYDHPAYLPPRRDQHSSLSAASSGASSGASGAHAQLKRLVARVVEEAASLPALARYAVEPSNPSSIEASTYEDLLATAILNKVIERYQTENGSGGRSSGIHSASASPTPSERSSPRSLLSTGRRRDVLSSLRDDEEEATDWEEGDINDDGLVMPRRVPFPEFGGDIVHTRENEEKDFDEVSGSDIQAVDGSWEENWLFQKKKIKTLQSVPVPMLVPNSNADYRALIGDRDAEDTTDLSDNATDEENEETQIKSDTKRILDSQHIIGGKPCYNDTDFEPDSLTSMDGVMDFDSLESSQLEGVDVVDAINDEIENSKQNNPIKETNNSIIVVGVDSGPLPKAEFAVEEIHRTVINGNDDFNKEIVCTIDSSNEDNYGNKVHKEMYKGSTNTLNGHEKEGEYEETVTHPVQRYADSLRRKHFEDEIPTRDTNPQTQESDLIPGSIADRERKKWLNYVEMPNNPYSPEAIQKRLSAKSNSAIFDMITTQTKELPEENHENPESNAEDKINEYVNETMKNKNISRSMSSSPAPKILKDVLAEEVPEFKRFGRDYYIKEAKRSTGSRKKNSFSDTSSVSSMNKSVSLDNFDTEFASTGLLIEQFNTIASNHQFKAFAKDVPPSESFTTTNRFNKNKNDITIEYDDINEQTLFSAKPVYINDQADKENENKNEAFNDKHTININSETDGSNNSVPPSPSLETSFISTSSNEDSIKIYNVQKGEIVKSKPKDKIIKERYEIKVDDNDNIDMVDKNALGNSVDGCCNRNEVDYVCEKESLNPTVLEEISELEEIALPNVKELARIFVNMETVEEHVVKPSQRRKKSIDFLTEEAEYQKTNKPIHRQAYMHSLTARSISKEFRDGLKLSMSTPLTIPGGSKELPEGIEEITKESTERPESPQPEPGTIKSKLAFFESLKSKFGSEK